MPGHGGEAAASTRPAADARAAWLRVSADAFDRALILLDEDQPRLAAGERSLAACAEALGARGDDVDAVLSALARCDPEAAAALRSLSEAGTPFDAVVAGPAGEVRLSGRAAGAVAMVAMAALRASPAPPAAGARTAPGPAPVVLPEGRPTLAGQISILEAVADAVAVFGPDRRLAYHNAAFARLWDQEPAWLAEGPTHGDWLDRLRRDRRAPAGADFARFKAEELARHERLTPAPEAIWRVAGGRSLRLRALPHAGGGLVLVFSDITSELSLRGQFNQLARVRQATLDTLTDAVAVFGPDARLKLRNAAFQRLWAIPEAALAGEAAFDDLIDFCLAKLSDLRFWRTLKGRVTDPDPAARAAARGEIRTAEGLWLAWRSRPLPDGATLISFADITDARRVEAALRDREDALRLTERLARDFVASVSYEMRTPLTTIMGYAELLDAAALPGRAGEWIGAVRAAAADLARRVEDILTLAEIDAGELILDLADTDVAALIAAAADRWRGRAEAAGARLIVAPGGDLGAVRADAARLARVLDHLVEHALGQTPPGGQVTLSARRAAGEARLEVADTGPGIPAHVQARIFDRFTGREGPGAGLGLPLVKALVAAHGGWVEVESAPGAGARFACHLPEGGQAPGSPD